MFVGDFNKEVEDYLATLTGEGSPAARAVDTVQRLTAGNSPVVHVIIDPTLRDVRQDALFQTLLDDDAGSASWQPLAIRHPAIDPTFVPPLLPLDLSVANHATLLRYLFGLMGEDWSPTSLQAGKGHRFCGLFIGASTIRDLALQFGSASMLSHPDGGRALVRWYDPIVAECLWDRLDTGQQAALLPSRVTWVSLDRQLNSVMRQATGVEADTWELTRSQWALLDGLHVLNPELARFDARHVGVITPQVRSALHDTVVRTSLNGIRDPGDLRVIVNTALCHHPRFDTHPLVRSRLAQRGPTQTIHECLSSISDADWQRVKNDLSSNLIDGMSK